MTKDTYGVTKEEHEKIENDVSEMYVVYLRGYTPYTDTYWSKILVHEHDDSIFVCIAAKKKVKCNHENINETDLNTLIHNKKNNLHAF